MKTLLLIDAHALIHRAFHALPPLTSPQGEPVQALYGLSSILLKIWREDKPDYAAALFDRPEPTFRKESFEAYKAHRPKAADELITQIIKSRELFAEFHIPGFEIPGFEADDLIGTLAERFRKVSDLKIVILTGDLDTLQLVEGDTVVVRALKTGISESMVYDELAVFNRYQLPQAKLTDYKALVGDPSDNIPGLPGVGPKTATALIQKYGSIEALYANLDKEPKMKEKFGTNHQDVVLYKKLTTIRKDAPLREIDLEELTTSSPNESLAGYFLSLGFDSLVKRLGLSADADSTVLKPAKKTDKKETKQELFSFVTQSEVKEKFIFLKDEVEFISSKEITSAKIKIGFGLKEKIKILAQKNLFLAAPYFDLGIGFWLLNPDARKYDPVSVSKKFLNRDFMGSDDDYSALYQFLLGELKDKNLSKIFYGIEMPLLPVLAHMELRGIGVNLMALKKLARDLESEIKEIVAVIHQAAGEKINLNSPKQLSVLLFEKLKIGGEKIKKTKTGLLSTNIDTLEVLKDKHPIIAYLLRYRELFKLQSTYVLPIIQHTDRDGRLRTDYIQTGTATGRLSSQNPNLQNIPAALDLAGGGENWVQRFRSAFVAPKGYLLTAFDYSQLELRILASVSEDEKMIEAFERGEDIHKSTAAAIFKVKPEAVTKDMRRVAKTLNFGIVYCMGADAFARTVGVGREEARAFIASYFEIFSDIKIWHEKIKTEGRHTGYVTNLNGRRRSVKGITYGASRLASEAERVAINMPIQSLEADIIKLAMIKVIDELTSGALPKNSIAMLLSIHDELLFEIDESIISDVSRRIKKIMESVFLLKVPLIVNVKIGKDWSALKEQ